MISKVISLAVLLAVCPVVNAEDKPYTLQPFLEAEKLLGSDKTYTRGIAEIAKFAREKKDSDTKFEAKALLSEAYRNEKKFDKADEVVSDCSDFDKISKNSTFRYKSSYLMAFLESAHCKAVNKDKPAVREAFKMIDYAEKNTESIDKARSLYKYGAVLFDIKEFSKADIYLRKAIDTANDCLINKKEEKVSAEDNKQIAENKGWQKLKPRIDELLFLVSIELLKQEYGEEYSLYVKARTLFDEKSYEVSMVACRDLLVKYPGTICEQAIRSTYSDCLLYTGNEKEAIKVLEELLTIQNSFYAGETMMQLGRIYLEKDWNADKSSTYYNQALSWFRAERERKDIVEIFTISEKLARFSAPLLPMSRIDEWNSTVYRKPEPKEIVNSKTASWYINESEKECLFMVGFFFFIESKFDEARDCFVKVGNISKDLSFLEEKNFPNAIMRLKGACKQGFLIARTEEMKAMKGTNKLKANVGDLKYVLEKFDEGYAVYETMLNDSKSNESEKSYALVGMGNCVRMKSQEGVEKAKELYKKAFDTYPKTVAAAHAMLSYAYLLSYSSTTLDKSYGMFLECYQKFSDTFYGEEALARLSINNSSGNIHESEKYALMYEKRYPNGHFNEMICKYLKNNKGE